MDSREPSNPHPWERYLPEGWSIECAALETGDLCLQSHYDGAVIERKTPGDLASCIAAGRERFERELKRGRYCHRLVVVVEGSLSDVVVAASGIHRNAIVGSIAAWTLAMQPLSSPAPSESRQIFGFRFLAAQLPSAVRHASHAAKTTPETSPA